jgi:Zn finger protein HypA/HybF involved in hydrogenase expression
VHELALIEDVVDAVTARVGARRVVRVRLRVGALVGVVPDALHFCFGVATEATALEGALLESSRSRRGCGAKNASRSTRSTTGFPFAVAGR